MLAESIPVILAELKLAKERLALVHRYACLVDIARESAQYPEPDSLTRIDVLTDVYASLWACHEEEIRVSIERIESLCESVIFPPDDATMDELGSAGEQPRPR